MCIRDSSCPLDQLQQLTTTSPHLWTWKASDSPHIVGGGRGAGTVVVLCVCVCACVCGVILLRNNMMQQFCRSNRVVMSHGDVAQQYISLIYFNSYPPPLPTYVHRRPRILPILYAEAAEGVLLAWCVCVSVQMLCKIFLTRSFRSSYRSFRSSSRSFRSSSLSFWSSSRSLRLVLVPLDLCRFVFGAWARIRPQEEKYQTYYKPLTTKNLKNINM